LGDQIKETEVVGTCRMHVGMFILECNIKIDLEGSIGHEDFYWFLVSTGIKLCVP
jgi:hypothetical protein